VSNEAGKITFKKFELLQDLRHSVGK